MLVPGQRGAFAKRAKRQNPVDTGFDQAIDHARSFIAPAESVARLGGAEECFTLVACDLAASRAFWFLQYALPLSKHFRITLFDLRGHGYSSMPASGYEAAKAAEDITGLLDHLGIASCVLVGHSYGGGVALEFAGRHPQRVEKLVVLDTKINALQPTQRLSDSPHLSPFEIESGLMAHASVLEAAVIGAPDTRWGERVLVIAVLKPQQALSLNALLAFVDGRLARYKLPRELHVIDAMPRNSNGKVIKTELRQRFAASTR